jgi:hypothetical protein
MEAMLSAQAKKPSGTVEAVRRTTATADGAASDPTKPTCSTNAGCLLREGTSVSLKFVSDLSSKTANEGDPVEFLLDDDLKVGESIVVSKGAHGVATVSKAKKAGMMGKPGDLSVQLQYLVAGSNHLRIRGTKGRQGDSKTGATVALVVLFGPIGLIKHGKNVEIAAGTPLTAYVDQDTWLDDGYATWHSDGTEIMNSGRPPITGNFCMGVWEQTRGGTYKLNHFGLSWNAAGTMLMGPANIKEQVVLDRSENNYSGTLMINQYDTSNHIVMTITGLVTAQRITVD